MRINVNFANHKSFFQKFFHFQNKTLRPRSVALWQSILPLHSQAQSCFCLLSPLLPHWQTGNALMEHFHDERRLQTSRASRWICPQMVSVSLSSLCFPSASLGLNWGSLRSVSPACCLIETAARELCGGPPSPPPPPPPPPQPGFQLRTVCPPASLPPVREYLRRITKLVRVQRAAAKTSTFTRVSGVRAHSRQTASSASCTTLVC